MNTQYTTKDSGPRSGAEQIGSVDPSLTEARAEVASLNTGEASVAELSRLANESASPALGTAVTIDGIERAREAARAQAELSAAADKAPQPGHVEVAGELGVRLYMIREALLNAVNGEQA